MKQRESDLSIRPKGVKNPWVLSIEEGNADRDLNPALKQVSMKIVVG